MHVKKILVPTDMSESSVDGIKYALFLAKSEGAEVIIVHVVDPKDVPRAGTISRDARTFFEVEGLPVATFPEYFVEAALEKGRWELSSFLARHVTAEMIRPVKLSKIVGLGDVVNEIVGTAKMEHCDLIVMASGGKNWLARLMGGSLTEKVVRAAPCPVLTIQPFARVRQDGERVPVRLLALGESHV
jgi:nucleotide-binding universal stress UspA family protein